MQYSNNERDVMAGAHCILINKKNSNEKLNHCTLNGARGGCARVTTHHYDCARAPMLRVCSAQPSVAPDPEPYQLAVHIMASPPRSLIKRPRTSPTYCTPVRPDKRRYLTEKENLLAPQRKLLTPTLEPESSKGPGNWDHKG